MSEMVERVAKAISGAPFPSKASMAKARAAIEAMREPTDEMLFSGAQWRTLDDPFGSKRWQDMIDAALEK